MHGLSFDGSPALVIQQLNKREHFEVSCAKLIEKKRRVVVKLQQIIYFHFVYVESDSAKFTSNAVVSKVHLKFSISTSVLSDKSEFIFGVPYGITGENHWQKLLWPPTVYNNYNRV